MSNELRIAVSGKSGCGNTTVSTLVAQKLGIRLINYTFHTMAEERGIGFLELCDLAEHDDFYDRHVDTRQVELAMEGSCVLASRLAIWLLEKADLKVFLDASAEVRAERIARRESRSVDEVLEETLRRDHRDRQRYLRLYGIDNNDYSFADLIIDTEQYGQEEVARLIVSRVEHLF